MEGTRFVYVNDAFTRMTGFSREALLALPSLIDLIAPDAREALQKRVQERLSGRRIEDHYETALQAADGRRVEIEVAVKAIRAGDNVRVAAILRDITARKQLEAQLLHAQKMDAIGRLAGSVAHDFNNLLTAIRGNSQLLLSDLSPEDPRREEAEEIAKAAELAAALTGQLLALSRRGVVESHVFAVDQTVAQMTPMLSRLIGPDITLLTETSAGLGRITADASQLQQVILNLALNARDAMPAGGRLTIRTAIEDSDDGSGRCVVLEVSDTGIGMDQETQARVFEPFFTTKEKGKGTGLGLAIVYAIVRQLGGEIGVQSESGRGTTFRISLPSADPAAAVRRPSEQVDGGRRGSETILLVEDEESVRRLTRVILERQGYNVLTATDGRTALEIAERHDGLIDLVLTDVVMPGMTGPELVRELARTRADTKVLYVSGYPESDLVEQDVGGRGAGYLGKPYTPAALTFKVRQLLDSTPRGGT